MNWKDYGALMKEFDKDKYWLKDAEYRQKNNWWLKHWQKLHLKYLRLKRLIRL